MAVIVNATFADPLAASSNETLAAAAVCFSRRNIRCSRHAHDVRSGAPIREKLLHRITEFAIGSKPAERALEIGEAEDALCAIVEAALRVTHKCGYRRSDARNRVHAAWDFFNVNTGISS